MGVLCRGDGCVRFYRRLLIIDMVSSRLGFQSALAVGGSLGGGSLRLRLGFSIELVIFHHGVEDIESSAC